MGHLLILAEAYQAQIWSVVLVVFGALVTRLMRLKPRLHFSVHHDSSLLVDQPLLDSEGKQISPRQIVRTASMVVGNNGLSPANNVEVSFNWRPMILNVLPPRSYLDVFSPFERYSLKFESVAPDEFITINVMSINAEMPALTSVRCDECPGKEIQMSPQRVWPVWLNYVTLAIFMLGLVTLIYLAFSFVI